MDGKNQINPTCNACKLAATASKGSVCLAPKWGEQRGLIVYVDHPDYMADRRGKPFVQEAKAFLDWCFKSMSVDPDRVTYDYVLRCYPAGNLPKQKAHRMVCIHECNLYRFRVIRCLKPRAIVAMGSVAAEAFVGASRMPEVTGRQITSTEPVVREKVEKIWIATSLQNVLRNAGESVDVFRVLFRAAEQAQLKPKLNPKIPPFTWEMR